MKRWIAIIAVAGLSLFLSTLLSNINFELRTVTAVLNSTQKQLESTETQLGLTNSALTSAETELKSTGGELFTTKTELESAKAKLHVTENELQSTKGNLKSAETELASVQDNLITVQANLDSTRDELADLEISYEGLITGHGYTIKDPTYNEMMRFLRTDGTDKAVYIKDEYVCTDFAADLCNSAEEEGLRCAYVSIKYQNETGHAIVAFNTVDKGLVYIEPQSDESVIIGNRQTLLPMHYTQGWPLLCKAKLR